MAFSESRLPQECKIPDISGVRTQTQYIHHPEPKAFDRSHHSLEGDVPSRATEA